MAHLNKNTCRPRQALDAISREYPGIWKYVDLIRAARGKEFKTWPDVCFLPIDSIYRTVNRSSRPVTENQIATEIFRISALAAWRVTQGIYRFDADVYEAVRDTLIEGNFPWKVLCNIPEWCIYIETPNLSFLQENIHGVWINIDWDADCQSGALCILLDSKHQFPLVLHLNDETVLEQVTKMASVSLVQSGYDIKSNPEFLPALTVLFTSLVSLAIFVCTQAAEVCSGTERPVKLTPKRIKGGQFRLFPPNQVTTWGVGVRMGAALRQARQRTAASEGGEDGSLNAPRGHIRRAHWHNAVTGPRKLEDGTVLSTSQRKLKVRWQPPLAINLNDVSELPATIRTVGSGKRATLHERPQVFAC